MFQSCTKYLLVIAVLVALSASQSCGCRSASKPKEIGKSAICILSPQSGSGVKGIVTMHQQSPFHPLYYEFGVTGLLGLKHHGVHIHEFGDLTQGCKSAGAHYNPYQKTHGGPKDVNRHAGDLGNLLADKRGIAQICMADRVTTLFGDRSIIGRSIVVHRNKDDLGRGGDQESTKTGNAGPRIACGVIGLASKFKHFYVDNVSNQMELQ